MPLSNHLAARWRRPDLFQQVGRASYQYMKLCPLCWFSLQMGGASYTVTAITYIWFHQQTANTGVPACLLTSQIHA